MFDFISLGNIFFLYVGLWHEMVKASPYRLQVALIVLINAVSNCNQIEFDVYDMTNRYYNHSSGNCLNFLKS